MGFGLTRRVLARLADAESHEVDPHRRDDYRIAWITVCEAANGAPAPHLMASRRVLGLNPEQVWPAIVARRKAMLGTLYAQFFPEESPAVAMPPKKPAQSVRLPLVVERKMRAGRERVDSQKQTARSINRAALVAFVGKPAMASPQSAYRSSDDLKSAKYAPPQPSPLVRRILASRLPGNLRLTFMSLVSASQQGPDFWASTFAVSIEAGGKEGRHSYRTVQRHIDKLERLRVLKKKHEANSFVDGFGMRRTATYVLHPEAEKRLAPRESYPEWRARHRRSAPARFRPQRAVEPVEVADTAPQPTPAASAAPAPVPSPERGAATHRGTERKIRELSARDGRELVRVMADLKKGVTRHIETFGGLEVTLQPKDPRYRAPMSSEAALTAACMRLGLQYDSARLYAERCGFKFESEESDQGP